MNHDTAIIPIARLHDDPTISELLEMKAHYSQAVLAVMRSDLQLEKWRECFERIAVAGLLTKFNLVIQQLGTQNGHAMFEWSGAAGSLHMTGTYDINRKTTEITVNGLTVLTNNIAGEVGRAIPGNWLPAMNDIFNGIDGELKRRQAEREAQAIRAESAERERLTKEFTADV